MHCETDYDEMRLSDEKEGFQRFKPKGEMCGTHQLEPSSDSTVFGRDELSWEESINLPIKMAKARPKVFSFVFSRLWTWGETRNVRDLQDENGWGSSWTVDVCLILTSRRHAFLNRTLHAALLHMTLCLESL